MMVTLSSWLKIPRSGFKGKTKSNNILNYTWKLLFLTYYYDEKGVGYNMIKDELCS
jgi:hypothetical protein